MNTTRKQGVTRRFGREWALQALVQFDLNPPAGASAPDGEIADFWAMQKDLELEALARDERGARIVFTANKPESLATLEKIKEFAEARMRGVWKDRVLLDGALKPLLQNWEMYRLGVVERNVLRMAVWELWNSDIPAPVIVNEAVDLAKFFSETKSGRFVNGVLDKNVEALLAARPQPPERGAEEFSIGAEPDGN